MICPFPSSHASRARAASTGGLRAMVTRGSVVRTPTLDLVYSGNVSAMRTRSAKRH